MHPHGRYDTTSSVSGRENWERVKRLAVFVVALVVILMTAAPALLAQERVGATEVLGKPKATAYMSGIPTL